MLTSLLGIGNSTLWVLLEKKAVHILDMIAKYLQLAALLEDVTSNLREFMAAEALPFGDDTYVVRDAVYESLIMTLM